MQAVFRWIAVVTLAVALTPWTTHAQTIQCVAPTISPTCTYSLDLPDSIRIRVVNASGDPMSGTVTFLGAPAVPQVGPTDRYGEVATQVRGSGSVDLTVEFSQVGQPSISRVVRIRPPTQSLGTITIDRGADQDWYAGRQLKRPVSITLDAPTCSNLTQPVAVFRPTGDGGHVSPDSVPLQNCSAETWWTLGDEVGTQHLAVSVAGPGRRVIAREQTSATARQGARLIFGLAVGWEQSFRAYVPPDSATVTTIEVDPVTNVTTQTTVKGASSAPDSREIDGRVRFRPTIGVDWAPFPSQERLRFSIAAAVQDLDRYFYVGASVLSWLEGIHHDPDPFGIHFFFQAARLEVAEEECDDDVAFCPGDDFELFNGGGFMVTIDPANVFTGLASILFR